jgi:hypothetical protein
MRHTAICILLLTCLITCTPDQTSAQGSFGIGLIVGEPTGLSWKYHLSDRNAIDGAFGFSPFDRLRLHADYLWTSRPFGERRLSFSYGVGGAIGLGKRIGDTKRGLLGYSVQETGFGVRGPVGVTYEIPRNPIEIGIEIAPILVFGPDLAFGFDGAVFFRFYP